MNDRRILPSRRESLQEWSSVDVKGCLPMAGCFVSWFERPCFLWDILHHFPLRSLFFSDLCTCRSALHLEFGMSGSFLSFRSLPKYCLADLPWPPFLLLIYLHHSLQFLIKFLLEYSCFTMLCWFQVHSKMKELYIYIYPLFLSFFSHVGHSVLGRVPCAPQRSLLIICF